REQLQQQQCCSEFERCRARQPGANRQIAAHVSNKATNRNVELPQFSSDSEDVICPTRVTKRSQVRDVCFYFAKTARPYANCSIASCARNADHAIDRRAKNNPFVVIGMISK